ncbi:MAG: hypothetical protein IJH20_03010 [Bacilli bacterium]|nr:hypothetical protein [Bacilli bacterium]
MIELYSIGISEETIKNMLEVNPEIKDLSEKEIKEKVLILEKFGCFNDQIINIISSNPTFLSRTKGEILNLVKTLVDYKFRTLNILLDSNPYILNLDPFEIKNYIEKRVEQGELLEDVIDDLDSNPILFNEM